MKAIGSCLIVLALSVMACAPTPSKPADGRESAYRENNRGVAELEQYAYEKAAQSFRRAIALDDRVALPHVNLAIALYHASNLDEAAAAAAEARRRLPNAAHAIFIEGLIARGRNRAPDAVAAFSRVLEIDPEDVGALINLGQTYVQERRESEAIPLFRAAVAIEPANATAIYSLGQALIRSGTRDEGTSVMTQFERVRDRGGAITYSQTYLEQGRYAEAMASTGLEPDLVDAATPAVSFSDQTRSWGGQPAGLHSSSGTPALGALTLADLDRDGSLELVSSREQGFQVLRWTGGRFEDKPSAFALDGVVADKPKGLSPRAGVVTDQPNGVSPHAGVAGIVAADLDNDERPDLLVLHSRGLSLHQQTSSGAFRPFPQQPSIAASLRTAAMLDVDHDGDLDVLAGGSAASGSAGTLRLLRNNGEGALTDITAASKLLPTGTPLALAPTDFDNRRDIDVLVVVFGQSPNLFKNQRDGSFRDVSRDVGLASWTGGVAVASGDLNKDGYTDFFVAKGPALAEVAFSNGRGRFTMTPGPQGSDGLTAVQCADYDNDGLLDIVGTGESGLKVFRNLGGGLVDVTTAATGGGRNARGPLGAFAVGDIDGDGDSDIAALTTGGMLRFFRNDGGSNKPSVRIRLRGLVSNRSAVGAKVDVRAGSLWQRFEQVAVTPAVAAQDLGAGLGTHTAADVVRVLWPAGILQAETPLAGSGKIVITELDRKPSSCPFLYAWNGASFEFVTDFLGAGELGYWTGAHGWSTPDGDEYVRLSSEQLAPRHGRFELRVTNELEEVLYLDRLHLLSIDHPVDVDVFPREGMRAAPQTGLSLVAVRRVRPLARVVTARGDDVTAQLARRDRVFAGGYVPTAIRGYADEHALIFETEAPGRQRVPQVLLLTGWTDYAFSSDNVAAAQRGWSLAPPRLETRSRGGEWRPLVADVGIPVGRPQTIVVDIGEAAQVAGTQFRLTTNMRIQWDVIAVADLASDVAPEPREHAVLTAVLAWRGYSADGMNANGQPPTPDYAQVSSLSPWKVLPGRYTREGDVRELLSESDNLFVVARTGDEVALAFSAIPEPPQPAGRRTFLDPLVGARFSAPREPAQPAGRRTFLLRAEGYSKEMDLNSSSPDHVLPLPFRGLTAYPTVSPSATVRARQRVMLDRYNTRVVSRAIPTAGK